MTIEFQIDSDIQIPSHLCSEAAELFLNHLEKYYEAQLLKGDSSLMTFQEQVQKNNTRMLFHRPLNHLGQTCPLYYKKGKGLDNASRPYRNRLSGTQC